MGQRGYTLSVRHPDLDPTQLSWQIRSYFDVWTQPSHNGRYGNVVTAPGPRRARAPAAHTDRERR
jgi:hypothetical protein